MVMDAMALSIMLWTLLALPPLWNYYRKLCNTFDAAVNIFW